MFFMTYSFISSFINFWWAPDFGAFTISLLHFIFFTSLMIICDICSIFNFVCFLCSLSRFVCILLACLPVCLACLFICFCYAISDSVCCLLVCFFVWGIMECVWRGLVPGPLPFPITFYIFAVVYVALWLVSTRSTELLCHVQTRGYWEYIGH